MPSLVLYRRSPEPDAVYWVRGTVQGQHVKQSTGARVRAHAEEIRAQLEADLFKRAVYGPKAVATFAEAALGYMQAGGERTHLPALLHAIGNLTLREVDQGVCDRLAAARPGKKPATYVRQIYAPISAVMTFAHEQKLCDPLKLRKPVIKNGRTEYLRPVEAEAWIESLPPHLAILITFYLATGCRASEALGLDWKDVSSSCERAVFWDTKADYPRGVNLPNRAIAALPERPAAGGKVFLNSRGEPWHGYDAINLMLKRHRAKPGNENLVPVHCHLLRHTWATWAYAVTKDLTFVMAQGGWRSLTLLGRYTHAASGDLSGDVLAHGWTFLGQGSWNRSSQAA